MKSIERCSIYAVSILKSLKSRGRSQKSAKIIEDVFRHSIGTLYLTKKDLKIIHHSSGKSQVENWIHWGRYILRVCGYLKKSQRGIWELSKKGKETRITETLWKTIWQEFRLYERERNKQKSKKLLTSVLKNVRIGNHYGLVLDQSNLEQIFSGLKFKRGENVMSEKKKVFRTWKLKPELSLMGGIDYNTFKHAGHEIIGISLRTRNIYIQSGLIHYDDERPLKSIPIKHKAFDNLVFEDGLPVNGKFRTRDNHETRITFRDGYTILIRNKKDLDNLKKGLKLSMGKHFKTTRIQILITFHAETDSNCVFFIKKEDEPIFDGNDNPIIIKRRSDKKLVQKTKVTDVLRLISINGEPVSGKHKQTLLKIFNDLIVGGECVREVIDGESLVYEMCIYSGKKKRSRSR